jgi:hypothetical protein
LEGGIRGCPHAFSAFKRKGIDKKDMIEYYKNLFVYSTMNHPINARRGRR